MGPLVEARYLHLVSVPTQDNLTCTCILHTKPTILDCDSSGPNQVFDFEKLSLSQSAGDFKGFNTNVFTPGRCETKNSGLNLDCAGAYDESACSAATLSGNGGNSDNDCIWTHHECRYSNGVSISSDGTGASANEYACRYTIDGHNQNFGLCF